MNILLLSTGGGGGNILRSLKALFHRDLATTQKTDPQYAKRLRGAVTTRFLDTNEFSLLDVPPTERLLVGPQTTRHLGARHSPEVAAQALEESRGEVEALIQQHSVVILIGTGGKGTGAGTMFSLAQMGREQKKLVLPIFVRPSFERHEVDKRRFDHALKVAAQFDTARIRLLEILNDRAYVDEQPQPQSVVWERMNLPIARGLRGLIYVLWDLSQVDPSDLSILFAGDGRFRIAFAEINPSPGQDPSDTDIDQAVHGCCENSYYAFGKPAGTSLVCIQGSWSNVVDARIKSRLAVAAMGERSDSPYNPLYARAPHSPRPWGVTALFAEYTGVHRPLDINWSLERDHAPMAPPAAHTEPVPAAASSAQPAGAPSPRPILVAVASEPARAHSTAMTLLESSPVEESRSPALFATLWEFSVAVNRLEPAALALAGSHVTSDIPIEAPEVKKLLSTLWFRAVVPRLSDTWKTRVLDALIEGVNIPNHWVKLRRQPVQLGDLSYADLREVAKTAVPDTARADLDLLLIVGRLWGADSVKRFEFTDVPPNTTATKLANLFQGLRHGDDPLPRQ